MCIGVEWYGSVNVICFINVGDDVLYVLCGCLYWDYGIIVIDFCVEGGEVYGWVCE